MDRAERSGKPRAPRGGGRSTLKASTKLYSFPADAPSGLRNEGAEDARCSRSSIARKGEEDTFPSRIPILYNAVVPSVPLPRSSKNRDALLTASLHVIVDHIRIDRRAFVSISIEIDGRPIFLRPPMTQSGRLYIYILWIVMDRCCVP